MNYLTMTQVPTLPDASFTAGARPGMTPSAWANGGRGVAIR